MPNLDNATIWFVATAVVAVLLSIVGFLWRRRRQEARDELALADAIRDDLHLPDSLHPVINPDICIGSLSCITACPEGDILGVVDGVAKLIIGRNCIGHGRCATECPVDAIKLVVGSSERGVDLPEVDTNFESSRAGVHVVGELGGMGLIKNAIRQGIQAGVYLAAQLGNQKNSDCDVAIVGAGPAGLATALALRAAGASFRILDQGKFGGTIAHYPRQKVVMTERVLLPLYGKFGKPLISKEELLALWDKIAKRAKLHVEEGVKVEGIAGADGAFEIETSAGRVLAQKVVLATGRRGSPRMLGVPGEELDKVTYSLIDAEQYAGKRVLVVGGGDSAIEAACAMAVRGDIEVALSYRQAKFGKCRDANRRKIGELIEAGEIHAFMGSTVQRVEQKRVTITHEGRDLKLPNDYVVACLGGDLPAAFLAKAGVGLVRHRGERPLAAPSSTTSQPHAALRRSAAPTKKPRNYLTTALTLIGASILVSLALAGKDYYLLGRVGRARSPFHEMLRPSGIWGHGIGIVATVFMMSNFLYPLRKRLGFMKGSAPIRSWLTVHIFVGIMSPLTIAFHAAFQSRNHIATATFISLLVVVVTGLIGRFVYGLVPSAEGRAVELSMVRTQLKRAQAHLRPLGHSSGSMPGFERQAAKHTLEALLAKVERDPEKRGSLVVHLLGMPIRAIVDRLRIVRVRRAFVDLATYDDFKTTYLVVRRLHTQVTFYRSLRRLLSGWRAFHVVLSVFLVVIIAVHVGLSIYLGYRWIL